MGTPYTVKARAMLGRSVFLAVMACASANAAEGAETGPSFDCDMAQTAIEKQICASPALAALDRTGAERYEALQNEVRSKALRNAIVADQRAWLKDRNACSANADPGTPETCLGDAYQQRTLQLDIHRSIFLGPPLPQPFRMDCQGTATTQVDMRTCLKEAVGYTERTLTVADEAATVEMRELDEVTSAGIGAEPAFAESRRAFAAYRDATCRAVAASYAGGSGTGVAMMWCQRQMNWDRANGIASDFLMRPVH